jgi:pSer/pThr/pTyr-binding forkhead associated (FHA) protein
MWNRRKLLFGLIGGFVGGVVGGALFEPIEQQTASPAVSRLIAIVAIGAITGIATGIIENAAKTGWLKVVRGLIAGKQFIIYRNPTFIGASPACEIYLFRDAQVAQRHAALHALPGRYEIQDLGGGGGTFVNSRSITRARLRNNDQVQIGSTCFTFQEKPRN